MKNALKLQICHAEKGFKSHLYEDEVDNNAERLTPYQIGATINRMVIAAKDPHIPNELAECSASGF